MLVERSATNNINSISFTTGCNILPVTSFTALFVSAMEFTDVTVTSQGLCANDENWPHSRGRAAS
jgi:hypothetical protein